MAAKRKWYVVWEGHHPGVYDTWLDCKAQVDGFPGCKYRSYPTPQEAQEAFDAGYYNAPRPAKRMDFDGDSPGPGEAQVTDFPIWESISVDAACSGNPGDMEYRGVYTKSKEQIFHIGPLKKGTNNIGEFLAIVHALALCKQKGWTLPIYSDSKTGMAWVRKKKCNTLLLKTEENEVIFELIQRAEKWLQANTYPNKILKWKTEQWLEIPADFGRK
ncbi:viroplasmin family protein [Falsiporphyromonas endometrii]|uniref:Ribonuclease H n=1 Tax=Falsiporphyromonas endometrii TaxID=1387297 RepID=A0ABV9KA87_9PORP